MKSLTLIFALITLSFSAQAQLPDGSIAPDFTAFDINGNEHNLYELLAEGKTVVLDVFATWCGPCWNFHETHALAEIFEEFGPDGTDEVFVFAVEGDGNTALECLYGQNTAGCNSTSLGDWTEGVPYPIMDNRRIATDFNISFFPTVYIIYPTREVYIAQGADRTKEGVLRIIDEKPALTSGTNPQFLDLEVTSGNVCNSDQETAPYYLLMNLGEETITSADITVRANDDIVYQATWTGEAKPYSQIDEINVDPFTMDDNTDIIFEMSNVNGVPGVALTHSATTLFKTSNEVTITINTDENSIADNNRYEIRRFGAVIHSEVLDENETEIVKTHILPDLGCYLFLLYDDAADGINGTVTIVDDSGNDLYFTDSFESLADANWNVSYLTNVNELSDNLSISVSPNPVNDLLNIDLSLESRLDFKMSINSVDGQVVMQENLNTISKGQTQLNYDLSAFAPGLYFLKLENEKGSVVHKFVKN